MRKIRKGDEVMVMRGRCAGTKGIVMSVIAHKVIVQGVQMTRRHRKPSVANPEGAVIDAESPVHISNVMLCNSQNQPSRVGFKYTDGKKSRVLKKGQEVV